MRLSPTWREGPEGCAARQSETFGVRGPGLGHNVPLSVIRCEAGHRVGLMRVVGFLLWVGTRPAPPRFPHSPAVVYPCACNIDVGPFYAVGYALPSYRDP